MSKIVVQFFIITNTFQGNISDELLLSWLDKDATHVKVPIRHGKYFCYCAMIWILYTTKSDICQMLDPNRQQNK